MNLRENLYNTKELENIPTRNGFGDEILRLGEQNEDIVVLTADLAESTRVLKFAEKFPDRFIEVGVAEQNLMGISAGLALSGKIPFAASYAVFSPGRNWDQLRVSVCYAQANVKIVSSHAGLTVGPDGATHQALEDIAITRVLPNLNVVVPCDYEQAKKATKAIFELNAPCYLRLGRAGTPSFTTPDTPFQIGKAQVYREGSDVTIVATGIMVYEALIAAHQLATENISVEVINLHTIKQIDRETLLNSASKTKFVLTAEEHQVDGGMGSAVAEVLSEELPKKIIRLGMPNIFGESGESEELLQKYGLTSENMVKIIKQSI